MRLGYDTDLLAAVSEKLARQMQDQRRDVKRRHDLGSVTPLHPGVMVAVQRFRSDLDLYVHLHCLARRRLRGPRRGRAPRGPADTGATDTRRQRRL